VVWLVGYLWLCFSFKFNIHGFYKLLALILAIKMSHLLVAFPAKMAHLYAEESRVIFVTSFFNVTEFLA